MVKQLWKVVRASWRYCLIAILVFYITLQWKAGYTPVQFHNNNNNNNSITADRNFVPFIDLREMKSTNISLTTNFTSEKRPLIPHIIHQIWDTDRVPEDFSEWISSWSKFHPSWEYWFWTHEDFRTFLQIVDPAFVKDYDSYKAGQLRADVMRFYIMYYFGGVYADLDVHVLKPLDKWTFSNHCILPEETHAHPFIVNNYTHSPAMITILLCRPGHPYFKLAIKHMHEYTTGTYTKKLLFVDDVYQEYLKDNDTLKHPENKIYLAPPEYFLPTYDPAVYSIMKHRCSADYIVAKMTKQQLNTCAKLDQKNWDNNPSKKSYTDHHWVHVIMNENGWKEKHYIRIQDIVPHRKNIAIGKIKRKVSARKSNTILTQHIRKRKKQHLGQ